MAKKPSLRKLIEDYLKDAKLMQLATSVNDQPWVCNVWFAADKDLNIYWFSSSKRRHSAEVTKNTKVAGAIALPQTPKDLPRGLQFQGVAELLTKQKDIDKASFFYSGRIFSKKTIKELMEDNEKPHHFYRIKVSQFVLFDAVNFADTNWRQEYKP